MKTASGATAVQIVHKRGRVVVGIGHIGSAYNDGQLKLLLLTAQDRLHAGQHASELEVSAPDALTATGRLRWWRPPAR